MMLLCRCVVMHTVLFCPKALFYFLIKKKCFMKNVNISGPLCLVFPGMVSRWCLKDCSLLLLLWLESTYVNMSSDIMAMPCYYFPSTLLSHGVIVLGLPMPHRSNGWINGIFLLDYGREEQCTLHLKTSLNLRWQMVSSNHQHFEYEKSYITSQMNTYST